jgi:aminoglycoside 6'-N-acetyltransferase I
MSDELKRLGPDDAAIFDHVAEGVYDDPLVRASVVEFLHDARHHVVVALDDGVVVGSVTAVHYLHPDKPDPEVWINELGVARTHRRRGLARALLNAVLAWARELGCREAWVLTHRANDAAMRLYASTGGREAARDQVMFSFPLD